MELIAAKIILADFSNQMNQQPQILLLYLLCILEQLALNVAVQ